MDRLIDRETDICVYHVCAYILREREREIDRHRFREFLLLLSMQYLNYVFIYVVIDRSICADEIYSCTATQLYLFLMR